MEKVRIRKFKKGDEGKISRLIKYTDSVSHKGFYPLRVIRVLNRGVSPKKVLKDSGYKNFHVAVSEQKIIGVIGLAENRIRSFFVHPKYQGRGIGRKLIEKIEKFARRSGITELLVHSSLTAKMIYEHFGFKLVRRFGTELNGVKFNLVKLKKILK